MKKSKFTDSQIIEALQRAESGLYSSEGKCQAMHIATVICFLFAIAFYLLAWSGVALGLAFIGAIFEIAAWTIWLASGRQQDNEKLSFLGR